MESLGAEAVSVRTDSVAALEILPVEICVEVLGCGNDSAAVGLAGYQVGIFRQHGPNGTLEKPIYRHQIRRLTRRRR